MDVFYQRNLFFKYKTRISGRLGWSSRNLHPPLYISCDSHIINITISLANNRKSKNNHQITNLNHTICYLWRHLLFRPFKRTSINLTTQAFVDGKPLFYFNIKNYIHKKSRGFCMAGRSHSKFFNFGIRF
jgi:hypothetical protein